MVYEQKAKSQISKVLEIERKQSGYISLLFSYFKRHPFFLVAILIPAMINTSIAACIPLIMREIISSLQTQGTSKFIVWDFSWEEWIYLQIGLYVILGVTYFLVTLLVGKLGKNIEVYLRNRTVKALLLQNISYYSDKKIGEILTNIGSDTWIVGEQTQRIPLLSLMAVFNVIGSSIVLLLIDWRLGLIAMSLVFIGLISVFFFFGKVRKGIMQLRSTITYVNGDVTDRIATIRLIKASGTEKYEKQRFQDIHKDFYKIVKSFYKKLSGVLTSGYAIVMAVPLVILTSAYAFYHNDLDKLILISTTFTSGLATLVAPIYQVLRLSFGFLNANECTRRVNVVINSQLLFDPHYYKGQGKEISQIEGDIIFDSVAFSYPDKPEKIVLPKFNFTFKKGKSYAFVGETGSGKSTISKLLLRFYDPTEGKVLINETENLKDLHLKSYLDLVGYVEQEPQILFGTVKENIKYTKPAATDRDVFNAAKKANLHNLIMSWPNKYNTILGERGFMLSGGQKQRLVIARMFLKDPQLLILDEATSALDNIVEKEIQAELEKLMVGRTSVTIAHRLSTIQNCDQIIVLEPGKGVVQTGTFSELRNRAGHFKKLYEAGLMSEKQEAPINNDTISK